MKIGMLVSAGLFSHRVSAHPQMSAPIHQHESLFSNFSHTFNLGHHGVFVILTLLGFMMVRGKLLAIFQSKNK